MKINITEEQFKRIINEIENNFDFNEMLSLKSYKERIAYCKKNLQLLGKGSSRMAFKLNNEKVLKIAINKKE